MQIQVDELQFIFALIIRIREGRKLWDVRSLWGGVRFDRFAFFWECGTVSCLKEALTNPGQKETGKTCAAPSECDYGRGFLPVSSQRSALRSGSFTVACAPACRVSLRSVHAPSACEDKTTLRPFSPRFLETKWNCWTKFPRPEC